MPLVPAICTQCGARLQVDSAKDAAICNYCQTPFITEKAITNYNTTNNITASTVNIYGGDSADFVIRAGILQKYNGASTDIVIPDSVVEIGQNAFAGCSRLAGVSIPNSVTTIGAGAFNGCTGLIGISIPESVTTIGNSAFSGCTGLTGISIPGSVTTIGASAFSGCEGLTSLTIPDSVKEIKSFAFSDCVNLTNVTLPRNVLLHGNVFNKCFNVRQLNFPSGVITYNTSSYNIPNDLRNPEKLINIAEGLFGGSLYMGTLRLGYDFKLNEFKLMEEAKKQEKRLEWASHGLCRNCGGKLGWKKCKSCGAVWKQ